MLGVTHSSIISVANQKGGVGKTTTAINLSACLGELGIGVLLVDLDPQANVTASLGYDKRSGKPSIYEALLGDVDLDGILIDTGRPGLWLAPSSIRLAGAELELMEMESREHQLRRLLRGTAKTFDLVIIDCPPSLGMLTVNALTTSEGIVVPIQCEYLALEGLAQLANTIGMIVETLNSSLRIIGIVPTMYDARTNLSPQVVEQVRQHFPTLLFRTKIPRSIRLSEAPSYGQTIIEYDPRSAGAVAYRQLAEELADRLKLPKG